MYFLINSMTIMHNLQVGGICQYLMNSSIQRCRVRPIHQISIACDSLLMHYFSFNDSFCVVKEHIPFLGNITFQDLMKAVNEHKVCISYLLAL